MTYEEQLQDERWLILADQVKSRDMFVCTVCLTSKNLQVHHKQYIPGRMAWEYHHLYLVTLCATCHKLEHENNVIETKEPDEFIECGSRLRESVYLLRKHFNIKKPDRA